MLRVPVNVSRVKAKLLFFFLQKRDYLREIIVIFVFLKLMQVAARAGTIVVGPSYFKTHIQSTRGKKGVLYM